MAKDSKINGAIAAATLVTASFGAAAAPPPDAATKAALDKIYAMAPTDSCRLGFERAVKNHNANPNSVPAPNPVVFAQGGKQDCVMAGIMHENAVKQVSTPNGDNRPPETTASRLGSWAETNTGVDGVAVEKWTGRAIGIGGTILALAALIVPFAYAKKRVKRYFDERLGGENGLDTALTRALKGDNIFSADAEKWLKESIEKLPPNHPRLVEAIAHRQEKVTQEALKSSGNAMEAIRAGQNDPFVVAYYERRIKLAGPTDPTVEKYVEARRAANGGQDDGFTLAHKKATGEALDQRVAELRRSRGSAAPASDPVAPAPEAAPTPAPSAADAAADRRAEKLRAAQAAADAGGVDLSALRRGPAAGSPPPPSETPLRPQ